MLSIINSLNFSFTQLLLYGVQVGHSFANSIFYAGWLVFSYCQKILIINLYKTFLGMRSGLTAVGAVCKMGGPVWFINLDSAAGIIVRSHAKFCGEFSATSVWINGLISNYNGVYNTFIKFKKIAFSAFTAKNKSAFSIFQSWYFTRGTWPRAVFVSSVSNSYSPTKEALQLNIPCLGIVDTNTYTHIVSIPIPGNDESIDCLVFYNDFLAQFILSQKYQNLTSWFFNIRKGGRFMNFKNWLIKKAKSKKKIPNNYVRLVKFNFNFIKHFSLGMKALFSQNKKYAQGYGEHLKVFEENDIFASNGSQIPSIFLVLLRSREYFVKLSNLAGYQKAWLVDRFIRTRFLQGPYFRKNLLNEKFIWKKLIIDRFYKTHLHWSNLKFIFLGKFLKFFLFYNFTHYVHLTKKYVFPDNTREFLGVIYFKAIADFFLNPFYPFPVEIYKKKDGVKYYNLNFYKNSARANLKLKKFQKKLNFNISPKMYRKWKTRRQNDFRFNKQLNLSFKRFVRSKMPDFCRFLKICLPKHVYKEHKFLIRSYFINEQKEKLSCISPKFIINPYKSNNIKNAFFFKVKTLLNKKQKNKLNKFFEESLTINNKLKKYTHYKHNKYFPMFFNYDVDFLYFYKNFCLFLKFFVLKKNFMPVNILTNLKGLLQKIYSSYKFRYLKKNRYLTNLEKFKIEKAGAYKIKKIKAALILKLKNIKKLKNDGDLVKLKNLKAYKKKLIVSNRLKILKIKNWQLSLVKRYVENCKRIIKPNPIHYKNNSYLTKFYFLKIFRRYKKKRFNLNLAYRFNLFKDFSLKKHNNIFCLRSPFNFKRAFKNFKIALGWLVLHSNMNFKFTWKFQSELILLPRWYFFFFPSSIVGNKEFYLKPIKKIAFLNYTKFNKVDSSLSKFFYLMHYSPYMLKFSYIRKFLNNYSIKYRVKNNKVGLHHIFINNISLKFKNFIKNYGHIWI